MSQPHEVIMYRNPAEYAMWNSGLMFPLMCGAAVMLIVAVLLGHILPYQWQRKLGWLPLIVAFLCGAGVVWWMAL